MGEDGAVTIYPLPLEGEGEGEGEGGGWVATEAYPKKRLKVRGLEKLSKRLRKWSSSGNGVGHDKLVKRSRKPVNRVGRKIISKWPCDIRSKGP